MPKNNGRARKAWRKTQADHNKRFWDKYGDCGTTVDYPILARGTKPDTDTTNREFLRELFDRAVGEWNA